MFPAGAINSNEVRSLIARIRASKNFAQSPRLVRFLEFTVEKTLEGQGEELKEYRIGVEVYGRSGAYDPKIDSIVRSEAVRLRTRLDQYYQGEGASECLLISYAKGRYLPKFEWRAAVPEKAAAPATAAPAAIAVLPFAAVGSDPESELFADGLTEELIAELARLRDVRVVARSSSFQFKGKAVDVREAGRQLNAGVVLEGSVRRWSDRLRVTAQLVEVTAGMSLWSATFERVSGDMFEIQSGISRAILAALDVELGYSGTRAQNATDPEVRRLCLEGHHYWSSFTLDGARKSATCFEQAIARDPRCARAWTGLGEALSFLAFRGDAPAANLRRAREANHTALSLDDWLPDAQANYGLMLAAHDWNWTESERRFQRALELSPGFAEAHYLYGMACLAPQGRFEEAARSIRIAAQLDPLACRVHCDLGRVSLAQGNIAAASTCYHHALEVDSAFREAHWQLGLLEVETGDYEAALASFARSLTEAENTPAVCGTLGHCYALMGRDADAECMLRRLEEATPESDSVNLVARALIHTGFGDNRSALECLEEAFRLRSARLTWIRLDLRFQPLYQEPRFQAILRGMGLAVS